MFICNSEVKQLAREKGKCIEGHDAGCRSMQALPACRGLSEIAASSPPSGNGHQELIDFRREKRYESCVAGMACRPCHGGADNSIACHCLPGDKWLQQRQSSGRSLDTAPIGWREFLGWELGDGRAGERRTGEDGDAMQGQQLRRTARTRYIVQR